MSFDEWRPYVSAADRRRMAEREADKVTMKDLKTGHQETFERRNLPEVLGAARDR